MLDTFREMFLNMLHLGKNSLLESNLGFYISVTVIFLNPAADSYVFYFMTLHVNVNLN